MTTPNTSISSLGISDINEELAYTANTPRNFNDGIFRNLTGVQARTIVDTNINLSDLSSKTAFGGIISPDSNTATSYGVITREIVLEANTDMYSPTVTWTANVISGVAGTLIQNGKRATYRVTGTPEANVTSNVQISAELSYQGHVIGNASKYLSFSINSLPSVLLVSGNTTANVVAFGPTSASVTLTASANVPDSSISFEVSPNDAGVFINGNVITLNSIAAGAGQDNNRSYSVTTKLNYNGQLLESVVSNVSVRAFYLVPDFVFVVPATSNNVFANTGTIRSSLTLEATHAIPDANISWSATLVSGNTAGFIIAPDNSSANLHINVSSGVFETKKSIYDVTAALAYSNGQIITSKTQRLTLRTGAYGLAIDAPAPLTVSGYQAQTAASTVTASYQAGTFHWDVAKVSGNTLSFSNTVSTSTATATLIATNTGVGTKSGVYHLNPVLTFDGIVMANVDVHVDVTAQQNAYSFSLSGPTTNTIIGIAPVSASLLTTATHDISGGTVVWTKNSSAVTLSSNTSAANTSLSNNTINIENFTLSASLRDQSNRVVEVKTVNQSLRVYDPDITWSGGNVTVTGFSNQSGVATANASARSGANTLTVTSSLLAGSPLTVQTMVSNSSFNSTRVSANQNTIGTTEGTVRLAAKVTWFGETQTVNKDITLSVTKDDPNFAMNGSGQVLSSYNFPVVANGSFVASHDIPGGSVSWTRTIHSGSVYATPVANNTNYVFQVRQPSVGTTSANVSVTAVLKDAAGIYVDEITRTVTSTSTVSNPTLSLNGPSSNVVSNTFHAESTIILTPSVAAGLTGHTYEFSAVAVSGVATVTSNSSAIRLYNEFDGAGSKTGTYDVTCTVVKSGQDIASVTRRVTVTATCPAPIYNFSASNDTTASFNFPVESDAFAIASTVPAGGVISWSWAKVSGVNATISTQSAGSRLNAHIEQSTIGSGSAVYDMTATYRTPEGTLLTTRTARVTATATRYNPALTWNYVGGGNGSNSATGTATTLSTSVSLAATSNASLSGEAYRITSVQVSGNKTSAVATSNAAGTATVTLSNNRGTDGTNAKTSVYDVFIDVVLNSQVIAGQVVRRTSLQVTPATVVGGNVSVLAESYNTVALAAMTFNPDGSRTNGSWFTPNVTGAGDEYEIMLDVTSGSVPNGDATNQWLSLSTARSWTVSIGAGGVPGVRTSDGTYSIRLASNGAVQATGNYNLTAIRESGA